MTEQRNEAYELVVAQQQSEIESLRAQLAEERQQKHEALHREYCRREELERQLAEVSAELEIAKGTAAALEREFDNHTATQAHAARLVEALANLNESARMCQAGEQDKDSIQPERTRAIEILSAPINLDALHEDRARTLEEAAKLVWRKLTHREVEISIRELAAAHRAKKEGK